MTSVWPIVFSPFTGAQFGRDGVIPRAGGGAPIRTPPPVLGPAPSWPWPRHLRIPRANATPLSSPKERCEALGFAEPLSPRGDAVVTPPPPRFAGMGLRGDAPHLCRHARRRRGGREAREAGTPAAPHRCPVRAGEWPQGAAAGRAAPCPRCPALPARGCPCPRSLPKLFKSLWHVDKHHPDSRSARQPPRPPRRPPPARGRPPLHRRWLSPAPGPAWPRSGSGQRPDGPYFFTSFLGEKKTRVDIHSYGSGLTTSTKWPAAPCRA